MKTRQGPRASSKTVRERIAIGIPSEVAHKTIAEIVRAVGMSENQINTALRIYRKGATK